MARRKGNPQVQIVKYIIRTLGSFAKSIKADGHILSSKNTKYFSFGFTFIGRSYCSSLPTDVPKGHCAVYVGSQRSRYIISTEHLNHPLFRELLDKAEEEYGFDHQLGLIIPCDEVSFQYVTSMLRKR